MRTSRMETPEIGEAVGLGPISRRSLSVAVLWALLTVLMILAPPCMAAGGEVEGISSDAVPGSGDGRIHILPTLSSVSLKNGDRATIQAVVKASAGVESVTARIEREPDNSAIAPPPVASITLAPGPMNLGGVNDGATIGLWQGEWTAAGLEEAYYRVAVTVTDRAGHVYTDRSLRFSDPVAGTTTVGSTAYADGGMLRLDHAELAPEELRAHSMVIDPQRGYALIGTNTSPGRVAKVALGDGDDPPTYVGGISLEVGEDGPASAVYDPVNGIGYFCIRSTPGRIVKVAIGSGNTPPSRVDSITLEAGEDKPYAAVIDIANGYAYFGTLTEPARIVKVDVNLSRSFRRLEAITLNSGEDWTGVAVLDSMSGYALFSTFDYSKYPRTSSLVKVDTSPSRLFRRVGEVKLTERGVATSGVIDSTTGYAYFATMGASSTELQQVAKVSMGSGTNPPILMGVATLGNTSLGECLCATIDPIRGYSYFGTVFGYLAIVSLGSGENPPAYRGATKLALNTLPICAGLDSAGGYVYVGNYYSSPNSSLGDVCKYSIASDATLPTELGSVRLEAGDSDPVCAVISPSSGAVYCGTSSSPARVVRVDPGSDSGPPIRLDAALLEEGEDNVRCAVVDPLTGFAYFGTWTSPGRIIKVWLGDGGQTPVRIGSIMLQSGEDYLSSTVVDPASGHAYFGTSTSPGRVVKVRLGEGIELPERIDAITMNPGENNLRCAVIDTAGGYACFGTNTDPGHVVKVDVSPERVFQRVDGIEFPESENQLRCAVIDPASRYAYFGTGVSPARVVMVDVDPVRSFQRIGSISLASGDGKLVSAGISLEGGHAYFGTELIPGRIIKMKLALGPHLPTRVGALNLNAGDDYLRYMVVNPASGDSYNGARSKKPDSNAYLSLVTSRVVRVALSHKGFVKGTRLTLPEQVIPRRVSFFSHEAKGNVRLALYSTASNPALLWESEVVANTASGGWLTAEIADGAPLALTLPAGNYWLAWQVDSMADVPSYTAGPAGIGFRVPHTWGPFPASLEAGTATAPTLTNERWSAYLTYDPMPPAAPSLPGAKDYGTDTITWLWQDNSVNETGFNVYAGEGWVVPERVAHTTAANVQEWTQTGLRPNTMYGMEVSAVNGGGESARTTTHLAWTLAATPLAPVVSGATVDAFNLAVAPGDGNPPETVYALHCATLGKWVQADGSLGDTPAWQTAAEWGTVTIGGLGNERPHLFTARARSLLGVETTDGPAATAILNVRTGLVVE